MATVTMINKKTEIEITGVRVDFIQKWKELGFEVKKFDSDKIIMIRAS